MFCNLLTRFFLRFPDLNVDIFSKFAGRQWKFFFEVGILKKKPEKSWKATSEGVRI